MTEDTTEKAMALFHGDAETAHPLARFGESRIVRVFADRIMATDNRKIPLNRNEAILYAQAAIAYRLDPFMGEIWAWVQEKYGRRYLTIMKGRDGTLKIAKDNARREDTYLLPPRFYMITDESKKERLQVPQDSLAFECIVQDYKSVTTWQSVVNTLTEAGFSKGEIQEIAGEIPGDWGLGVLTKSEIDDLNKGGQNKMTHVERCQKRAQTAALRKRWAAQEFGELPNASIDTDDYIIEGEWLEVTEEPKKLDDPKSVKEKAKEGNRTLYGEPRLPNQWENKILDKIMELQLIQARPHAVNILNQSPFTDVPYGDLDMTEAIGYVVLRSQLTEEFPEVSSEERMKVANVAWERGDNEDAIAKALELLGETA